MNHTEYTTAQLMNRLACAMPTTRLTKVILGTHIVSGILVAILFFCTAVGAFGDTSYNRSSTITGCLLLVFINALWVWACFVAYLSIEKLRDHARTLSAEAATVNLLQNQQQLATK
jgi:hypothetical protein